MQRPIEVIYQSLVPGISTITLRYRYYSFFPFILRHYEENIRHPDPKEFRKFQRRCEALFALICTHGEAELGITGSDWANKRLNEVSGDGGEIGRAPSELQSLMRISYAVFCLKKKKKHNN